MRAIRLCGMRWALLALSGIAGCGGDKGPTQPADQTQSAPPTRLAFLVQPPNANLGVAWTPGVRLAIQDASGKTVTSATAAVTVALGINPKGGTLLGTKTVNAVAGVATFGDLAIDRSASGYTLVATSGTLTQATSSVFEVAGPSSIGTVKLTPSSPSVAAGAYQRLDATFQDASGATTTDHSWEWSSSNTAVASFSEVGKLGYAVVFVNADGTATITATSEGVSGSATVTVTGGAVATVTVSPSAAPIVLGGTRKFTATTRAVSGNTVERSVSWSSGNVAVATVNSLDGYVTAVSTGTASITATVEGKTGAAVVTVITVTGPIMVSGISSASSQTCGLAPTGAAYCWGMGWGGDGTEPGYFGASRTYAVAVAGGLTFTSLAVGSDHVCGLTSGGKAYCWGDGGTVGDGTNASRTSPVAVVGGNTFTSLAAGGWITCGLTSSGLAYCWGGHGKDGIGNSPTAVSGGIAFKRISVGGQHICGLATNGAAYCWGDNQAGQLGIGTSGFAEWRASPLPVRGGLSFKEISAGELHTCGLTSSGAAYCWGSNNFGRLGDGTRDDRSEPAVVVGGVTYTTIVAGGQHTCGLTSSGAAYCWGYNAQGQLGGGAVQGLAFASLGLGNNHTCGSTTGGAAYCWGYNEWGQLGDGTTRDRAVPTPVRSP